MVVIRLMCHFASVLVCYIWKCKFSFVILMICYYKQNPQKGNSASISPSKFSTPLSHNVICYVEHWTEDGLKVGV